MRMRWVLAVLFAVGAAVTSPSSVSAQAARAGLQVHGHWTIDVRRPDGTLIERREFENALTTSGQRLLANVLARQASPGYWMIELEKTPLSASLCQSVNCYLVETGIPAEWVDSFWFPNLTVTLANGGTAIELRGQATIASDSLLGSVGTVLSPCTPVTDVCFPANPFTRHTLASPIAVSAGQIVQVKVQISFS